MKLVVFDWCYGGNQKAIESVGLTYAENGVEQEVTPEQIVKLFELGCDVALMQCNLLAVEKGGKRFHQR